MKKSTWIVLALVIVLGATYFLSRGKDVSVGVKLISLPSFKAEDIDRIELSGKDKIELNKEADHWLVGIGEGDKKKLVEADDEHVKSLLEAVAELKPSHYVSNLKEKYSELGIDEPQATILKLFAKDAAVYTLVLGKNASGSGRYAKMPESDDVYVLRGSFWPITRNGASDFRNREIWDLNEAELKRYAIEPQGKLALIFDKVESAQTWQIDKNVKLPPHFRLDNEAVQSLVKSGLTLKADAFIDEPRELGAAALKILAEGGDKKYQLTFFVSGKDQYIVKREDKAQLYEISDAKFKRINKALEELRDLSVLKFDKNLINKISIKHDKKTVLLSKKDKDWLIEEPKTLPKDFEFEQSSVEDLLNRLSSLSAERVANAKDVGTKTDWQKNWVVELSGDNNEKIHVYTSPNKANKEELLVKGNIDSEIYVIKAMRLSALSTGVQAFNKEEFELPPIDERTKGFETLPVDIQRKLLNATKEKKK